MSEPDPRLIAGYARVVATVRARVAQFIEATWGSLDSWRTADIERFVDLVIPVTEGAKVRVAAYTDAYLATFQAQVLGHQVQALGVSPEMVTTQTLRGISAEELYQRAGVTVWSALSDDVPFTDALARGLNRAQSGAATDIQLARTHMAQRVLGNQSRIVGYRRVLTGRESCGLCVVASSQRYHRKNLMPIHPGCDCSIAPIIGKSDPGRVINKGRLESSKTELGDRFGKFNQTDLRGAVVTHEHGEIGPLLAVRGHHFTGPNDL